MLLGIGIGAVGMLLALYIVGIILGRRGDNSSVRIIRQGPDSKEHIGEKVVAVIRRPE